jgi:hypothetical protein
LDSPNLRAAKQARYDTLYTLSSTHHYPILTILIDEMTMDLTRSSGLEKPGARGVVWTTSSLLFCIWHPFILVVFGMAWCSRRNNGAKYGDACSMRFWESGGGWYCDFSDDGRDEGGGEGI